jgi:hypothetical protein
MEGRREGERKGGMKGGREGENVHLHSPQKEAE